MCGDRQWTEKEIAEAISALGGYGWHSRLVRDIRPDSLRGVQPFSVTHDEAASWRASSTTPADTTSDPTGDIEAWADAYIARFGGDRPHIVSSITGVVNAYNRASVVLPVRAPTSPPVLRRGRQEKIYYNELPKSEPCPWDTDGDGNCAFHSDCASGTFRHR